MPLRCPNCKGRLFTTLLDEESVRKETFLRARFVAERVEEPPSRAECKDLTDFAHGGPASIVECDACGVLVRAETEGDSVGRYRNDPNDAGTMERLFPRYVEAFRRKEQPYRSFLPAYAAVLEIGSHLGAFLKVAGEWNWRAEGIDVGRDTANFARSRGGIVHEGTLFDCRFPRGGFDAVFVWNCFEQIEEPHATLAEIRRVLKPGGLLLLRTPNALFYRACERFLDASAASEMATWVRRALGYSNLLAFPYLYGYQSRTLIEIAKAHGFQYDGRMNAEVITFTFPVLFDWIVEEAAATRAALLEWDQLHAAGKRGELTGPWIEVFCRAV